MPPGLQVVKSVEHQIKLPVKRHPELRQHDVCHFTGDLYVWPEPLDGLRRDRRLPLPDMMFPKQKLPVEVRHIDRVKVDDMQALETGERQRLEQLAPDATSPDDQDSGRRDDLRPRSSVVDEFRSIALNPRSGTLRVSDRETGT